MRRFAYLAATLALWAVAGWIILISLATIGPLVKLAGGGAFEQGVVLGSAAWLTPKVLAWIVDTGCDPTRGRGR